MSTTEELKIRLATTERRLQLWQAKPWDNHVGAVIDALRHESEALVRLIGDPA